MNDLLANFEAGFPFPLDAYQREACAEVAAGKGVLVAAPTGAGKTVVGEFAAHMAIANGAKCFYTTPIKALSNQKYHDLAARYGEGRIGLLTGDTSINGEAEVVVMTTEVLRNMIYAGSNTLANLGFVVMDEVHYLSDRFRGAAWEEVIISLAPTVQLVALSATVSNAEEFGEWLAEVRGDVAVVVSERRPVPLYQHVMAGHRLYDLFGAKDGEVNAKLLELAKQETRALRDDARNPRGRSGKGKRRVTYGSGRFGGASYGSRDDSGSRLVPKREAILDELNEQDLLPAIYFIFSRVGCDKAVRQLLHAQKRFTNRAEYAQLEEIANRHTAALGESDLQALGYSTFLAAFCRGIVAHHAGLLPALKEAVEEGFAAGLLKVVFATETLALGINMPARSVVLEKLVKYNGEGHVDITAGEYTQLTGRAGRRGIDV
ncbi:MAG: DEAD/DEAH box helicase, partial [Propionibacteriaceae bacterium]|nr:DEAD/DEAH box helicase [Propionibacteriaceae bacterium]